MVRPCLALVLLFLLRAVAADVGWAQEFRVYTTVYNESARQPQVASRSVSLFHAGKTYDYVDEVGEVIVFEPARDRFTLLNTRQMKSATVHFDVLKRQLKLARQGAQSYLQELKESPDSSSAQLAALLEFQLAPEFETVVDENRRQLTLDGGHVRYTVQGADVNAPDRIEAYLRYADWICRLNYILHPGALLPESRLVLNQKLREAGWIPTRVSLAATVGEPIRLRAEHKILWDLNRMDRQLIRQWEQTLAGAQVEHLTFEEYQRAILLSSID